MAKDLVRNQPLFTGLSELHQALDRLFDRDLLDNEMDFPSLEMTHWIPKIDVTEGETQYIIRADMPGVSAKDIEVTLENGTLTIKGKKESETKEKTDNYVRVERSSGSFYRALTLPNAGDPTAISAKSRNGVLEITVPKTSKKTLHKIEIKEE